MVWNDRAFRTIVDSHKERTMHLHETETPILNDGATIPVGYKVETKDFSFSAVYETDGTVTAYVEWGDDQGGDMTGHDSMADAKRWLDTLILASYPEQAKKSEPEKPKVEVDIPQAIKLSVDAGLKKASMEDTPANRLVVLKGMHSKLVDETPSAHSIRHILQAIEDQIIHQDEQL